MKFLVVATGGTIASISTPDGLKPGLSGEQIIARCQEINSGDTVDIIDLFAKDSTNITPADWFTIAKCINGHADWFDATIVLHGTDTMAWTSTALSFLTDSLVVLTGSMLPSGVEGSDADANLNSAFGFAREKHESGINGVFIAFAGKLLDGACATKMDSEWFDAFEELPSESPLPPFSKGGKCRLPDSLKGRGEVAIVPIFPGMTARYLDAIIDTGVVAIFLEGFGSGGVPDYLLPCIERAVSKNIKIVLGTSCPRGGADPTHYEVGVSALRLGAISGGKRTRENIAVRLMLGLEI